MPEKERGKAHSALEHLMTLWSQNKIGGKAMGKALAAWRAALIQAGVADTTAADAARIQDIAAIAPFPDISIDCDPKLRKFIKLLGRTLAADQHGAP